VLKKIPLINKLIKSSSDNPTATSGEQAEKPAGFLQQKELDKKLVYTLNKKKIPTLKQLKYLPKVLDKKQQLIAGGLLVLIIVSLGAILVNFFNRNFVALPKPGGEYTIGLIGAPQYINPLLSQTNDVDADIARLVFSGLVKYNNELQLEVDLASGWQISEDQKNYLFTLKDNLKWQDGQPITADDVIFTFQSIKDPEFKSPLLISFRGVEIEKVDEKTVRFVLPEIYPSFLDLLTVGILPSHIWGEIPPVNANLTEYNLKPIGSGPWKFKSLAKDRLGNIKSYTLVANENYYAQRPYLEKINFKFYPDFETAVAALKNHSTNGISFLPKDFKSQLGAQKNLKYYSLSLPQYTAIFFNQKQNESLKDKNVRKALALSINKEEILNKTLQLDGKIIDGPILPVDIQTSPDKALSFNLDQANKTLDDAGWQKLTAEQYQAYLAEKEQKAQAEKEKTTAGAENNNTTTQAEPEENLEEEVSSAQTFYRKKSDTILEINLTTVNQSENIKAAKLVQQAWEKIGAKVSLQIVEGSKISRDTIKPRNYQALLFGIIVGSDPDPYAFWHSSQIQDPGLNLTSFANRDTDAWLQEARKTNDWEKKTAAYQKFQDTLASETPAIFLYKPTYTYVADQKIKGIGLDRIIVPADRLNDSTEWYVKVKWSWQKTIR